MGIATRRLPSHKLWVFVLVVHVFGCGVSSFAVDTTGLATTTTGGSKNCGSFDRTVATTTSSTMAAVSSSSSGGMVSESSRAEDASAANLPWRDTNHSPLTGTELRNLVVEASVREEHEDPGDDWVDVPGVAWMEHLNLVVGHGPEDRQTAEAFYIDVLGMTPDASKSFHVNLGRQQFHLATPASDSEDLPHRIHGSVGLVVPDLATLWERLRAAREDAESSNRWGLRGTLFGFYEEHENGETTIHVRCPWGNVFRCYAASARGVVVVADEDGGAVAATSKPEHSPQKMTNLHAPELGVHGADKMGILKVGDPGIRYVEFLLPHGVRAQQVCEFYRGTLQAPTRVLRSKPSGVDCCLLSVGPGIHLVFVETANGSNPNDESEAFRRMRGIHVCLYAHDFRALYDRLTERSLVWTNPRFRRLDSCDTWEEARRSRTLRFKHIVDAQDNVLMELEHETRPLRHGQFLKVPRYVPK